MADLDVEAQVAKELDALLHRGRRAVQCICDRLEGDGHIAPGLEVGGGRQSSGNREDLCAAAATRTHQPLDAGLS
ncbi:hypothetical protein [Planctomonas sp. JC2975]|uniref:hypothetical protein n=1 Tax=Planctomonas sp. JC2975 TaxID=2729626 RepID=UPI001472B40F|nr:hypothetical protein [Planctomonas sp. JC2975]